MKRTIDFNALLSSILPSSARSYVMRLTKLRKTEITEDFNPEKAVLEYQQTNDEDLLMKVVLYNLPMAVLLVKNYSMYVSENDVADLLSVAFETIIKCAQKYDQSFGTKFSSYLVINMRGELLKYLDEIKPVKFNYHYHKQKNKKDKDISDSCCEEIISDKEAPSINIITGSDIVDMMEKAEHEYNLLETYVYINTSGSASQNIDQEKENYYKQLLSDNLVQCMHDILAACANEHIIRGLILMKMLESIQEGHKFTASSIYKQYPVNKREVYNEYSHCLKDIKECLFLKALHNKDLHEALAILMNVDSLF